jgi:MYXO-CTERM domain-containing protein
MNARLALPLAVAGLVLGADLAAAQAAAGTDERVTRSAAGHVADHPADTLRDSTSFEVFRRQPGEIAVKPRRSGKALAQVQAVGDAYVYDATTDTFADRDADGYFRFIRVQFDVDSVFPSDWVYAEIYLSADGNAWEHLYSTADFEVFGSDPEDDYEVETELVSGYAAGLYDVLIELYDADTNELLDEFGPNESPEFSMLPLEDASRDGVVVQLPDDDHHHGGGGAVSWLGLAGLIGALALRRRRSAA